MIFNNKRTETEMIYDLLSSAQKDIKKTHLMYKVNMPYVPFMKYLNVLKEKGLLGEKDSNPDVGKVYHITEYGKELMEHLNIVKAYLK